MPEKNNRKIQGSWWNWEQNKFEMKITLNGINVILTTCQETKYWWVNFVEFWIWSTYIKMKFLEIGCEIIHYHAMWEKYLTTDNWGCTNICGVAIWAGITPCPYICCTWDIGICNKSRSVLEISCQRSMLWKLIFYQFNIVFKFF